MNENGEVNAPSSNGSASAALQNGNAAASAGAAAAQPSRLCFFLDGAHTEESMATCAAWFADAIGGAGEAAAAVDARFSSAVPAAVSNGAIPGQLPVMETQRLLLFNCMQARPASPERHLAPDGLLRQSVGVVQALCGLKASAEGAAAQPASPHE